MQASDTVYITTEEANPPELQLTGPTSLFVAAEGPVKADVTAGDDPVSRLDWSTDGTDAGGEQLTGEQPSERRFSFSEAGTHTVTAVVTDVLGRTTTDTHTIDVIGVSSSPGPGTQSAGGGGGGGGGGSSSDADTDFVAASDETIRSYSDLAFNNYADGNSAITLANTAGPGDITIVDEETARNYLEPYNWHNVNLGELVEDNLVDSTKADKILKRAKQNQDEVGKGAVGGINPYTSPAIEEPPEPPSSVDQPTPQPTDDTTASINPRSNSDPVGPSSPRTVTITQSDDVSDSDAGVENERNEAHQANSDDNVDSSGTTQSKPQNGSTTVTFK